MTSRGTVIFSESIITLSTIVSHVDHVQSHSINSTIVLVENFKHQSTTLAILYIIKSAYSQARFILAVHPSPQPNTLSLCLITKPSRSTV
jgi:hypothetical protein